MPQAQLQGVDYVVIAGYFILMVVIGLYFRRFMLQAKDYFTGANQVPWWLAGVSYYMTTFSAFAFIAYGEIAYLHGWAAVTLVWTAVPACLVAAFWIAPLWRRARVLTPVEFLETRYSHSFRQLFAWSGFPLRLADNGLRLYSLGVFVAVAAGMNIITAIAICGLVMLAYTFLGGLWAVAVTDFVQGVVLLLALLIIFPLAYHAGGGFSGFLNNMPTDGYLNLFNAPYTWVYILGFAVLIMLNYNAGWALVQRFYSVRDEKEARKVGLMAAGLNVVGPPLFFLPVMLSQHVLPPLENTRHAYVSMTLELLPVGMVGIMITAMLAATMSSLSSEYNVLASVATKDIYNRLFHRAADEKRLLLVGRIFTAAIGLVIMGIAIVVTFYPDSPLFSVMLTIFGVAVAPMMLPLLGGLMFRQLTLRGAVCGFVVGLNVGFTTLGLQRLYLPTVPGLDPDWITFQFGAYAIFINVGVTALAMVLWTWFEQKSPKEQERIDLFFARLSEPVEASGEPLPRQGVPSPFFITGLVILGIGVLLLGVSLFEETTLGRWINVAAGLVLLLSGYLLYRKHRPLDMGSAVEPLPAQGSARRDLAEKP
jgi:solute:Na+ symporter, SSS family